MKASAEPSHVGHATPIVDRVLTAVAGADGRDTLDLPPLYEVVDPDALERIAQGSGVTTISFAYQGYVVRIEAGGRVSVTAERE